MIPSVPPQAPSRRLAPALPEGGRVALLTGALALLAALSVLVP